MAEDLGYSPPYIDGPSSILKAYKDNSKNTQLYLFKGHGGAVGGYWTVAGSGAGNVSIPGSSSSSTVVVTAINASGASGDVTLDFRAASGSVLAAKTITIAIPGTVNRPSSVTVPYPTGGTEITNAVTFPLTILDQFGHTIPAFSPVGETLSDQHSSELISSSISGSGSVNSSGVVNDTWSMTAYHIETWMEAKQAITLGDWTDGATFPWWAKLILTVDPSPHGTIEFGGGSMPFTLNP
jgi:hypothetical protein